MVDKSPIFYLSTGEDMLMLGGDGPYRIVAGGLSGFETPSTRIKYTRRSRLPGAYVTGAHVEPRHLRIRFEIDGDGEKEVHRRRLLSFLVPGKRGLLTAVRGLTVRRIAYYPEGEVIIQEETRFSPVTVTLSLFCPEPYFRGETVTYPFSGRAEGLLTFPLTFTAESGITAGVAGGEREAIISNEGDAAMGICAVVTVSAADGAETFAAVNPTLTLAGVGSMKIEASLSDGDTLTVSTEEGEKCVRINGVLYMRYTAGSRFFALPPGKGTLTLTWERLEGGRVDALVTATPRYYGI